MLPKKGLLSKEFLKNVEEYTLNKNTSFVEALINRTKDSKELLDKYKIIIEVFKIVLKQVINTRSIIMQNIAFENHKEILQSLRKIKDWYINIYNSKI